MKNIDFEAMRYHVQRIQAAADPLTGHRKLTAYRQIECELIRCRGLFAVAMELAVCRHEDSGDPMSYDGMTRHISKLIGIVEEIEYKLTDQCASQ